MLISPEMAGQGVSSLQDQSFHLFGGKDLSNCISCLHSLPNEDPSSYDNHQEEDDAHNVEKSLKNLHLYLSQI